jgi:hypothetical protein
MKRGRKHNVLGVSCSPSALAYCSILKMEAHFYQLHSVTSQKYEDRPESIAVAQVNELHNFKVNAPQYSFSNKPNERRADSVVLRFSVIFKNE